MINSKIHLMSLNVRGLNNDLKRKKIFLWMERQQADIVLMQETYCTKSNVDKIEKDWKGRCLFGLTNSVHSRGVAVLIRDACDIEVIDHHVKDDGRIILVNLTVHDQVITIINVYCPNNEKERIKYIEHVEDWIRTYSLTKDNLILAGDFNTCLRDNDRSSRTHIKDKSREKLKSLLDIFEIDDIWHKYSKQKDHYTWADATLQSRLDYFFCSKEANFEIKNICTKTVISNKIGNRITDHKALSLAISMTTHKRGPGYWKLNTTILKHEVYKKEFERIIGGYIDSDEPINHLEKWEMIKIRIRELSIRISKVIRKEKRDRITTIERLIEKEQNIQKKQEYEHEMNKLYAEEAIGAQIRAKAEIVDDGEYNTKLFKSIEKSTQTKNTICELKDDNGNEIQDQGEMLKHMCKFFNGLYKARNVSNDKINKALNSVNVKDKLTMQEKETLERQPELTEIENAMNRIKENKSPGLDGIPIELYRTFWHILKIPYMNMIQECAVKGMLPYTTRTSVLSLIYKKGDRKELKNYRPLSLSNTDYKIIANVMSDRLNRIMSKLVSNDQSGYIKGRNITTSVRQILDIYEYCENTNTSGAIICIDFEKAFDSIEHKFLYKVLEKFNFGSEFISWIKLLYTEPKFKIKNNGWISEDCFMNRGVRQGCSMSALLFILVVEILAQSIKQNEKIEGIIIGNTEHKICQYADDSTIFIKTLKSIGYLIETFDSFATVAGLKLNMTKTKGILVGGLKDSGLRKYQEILFTGNPVKCLGIYIGHNKEKTKKENWDSKIESIKRIISYWNNRRLSLFAKIKVIKTYVISKIAFVASVIEMPDEIVKSLKTICYNYLWGGKRDKIKRTTITANRDDGGLKMIDIDAYITSLKASWVPKILNIQGVWKNVFEHYVKQLGFQQSAYIFKMNFKSIESMQMLSKLPRFYIDVLTAYNKSKELPAFNMIDSYNLITQPIWGNLYFQNNMGCLYFKAWVKSNILYIKDLINADGTIKNENEICGMISDKRSVIQEMFIVKNYVINKIKNKDISNAKYVKIRNETKLLYKNKYHRVNQKKSKFFYDCLKNKTTSRGNMETIWARLFGFDNSASVWNKIYKQKVISLGLAKLEEFNYKVLHNILPCGKVLSKWLQNCSEKCKHCGTIETTEHMLFHCKYIINVWKIISDVIKVNVKWKNIVCGMPSSENSKNLRFINLVITIVSYSIFKSSNKSRWCNQMQNEKIEQTIVKDILFYKLIFKTKGNNIFEDVRIQFVIDRLLA